MWVQVPCPVLIWEYVAIGRRVGLRTRILIRKHFKDNKNKRYANITDNRSPIKLIVLGPYRDKYDNRIKIADRGASSKYIKRTANKHVRRSNLILNNSDYKRIYSYINELI